MIETIILDLIKEMMEAFRDDMSPKQREELISSIEEAN